MAEQAKVPAIRFAGFTDPWERRELRVDLFEESDERASDEKLCSSLNGMQHIWSPDGNESWRKYRELQSCVGDVVYNSMRMWQGV